MSEREPSPAEFMWWATVSCRSFGSRPHDLAFTITYAPSHIWPVSEQNFCTSYRRPASTNGSGFSCASAILVCSAEYSSAKLTVTGEVPRDLKVEVHNGLEGTRIRKFCRSTGVTIGLVEVVMCRNPLSHALSIGMSPTFAIWLRTYRP